MNPISGEIGHKKSFTALPNGAALGQQPHVAV